MLLAQLPGRAGRATRETPRPRRAGRRAARRGRPTAFRLSATATAAAGRARAAARARAGASSSPASRGTISESWWSAVARSAGGGRAVPALEVAQQLAETRFGRSVFRRGWPRRAPGRGRRRSPAGRRRLPSSSSRSSARCSSSRALAHALRSRWILPSVCQRRAWIAGCDVHAAAACSSPRASRSSTEIVAPRAPRSGSAPPRIPTSRSTTAFAFVLFGGRPVALARHPCRLPDGGEGESEQRDEADGGRRRPDRMAAEEAAQPVGDARRPSHHRRPASTRSTSSANWPAEA